MFNFTAVTDANFDIFRRANQRRQIFYSDNRGATPLSGLLSMLEPEITDGSEFTWLEHRQKELTITTALNNAFGGWLPASGAATSTQVITHNGTFRLQLAAGHAAKVQINQLWLVPNVKISGQTAYVDTHFRVTAVDTVTDIITVVTEEAFTIDNAAGEVGKLAICLGNAQAEGSYSAGTGMLKWPTTVGNYTQIFRHPYAFARSAIQNPLTFDSEGPYKLLARQTSYEHMSGLENAILFGKRTKNEVLDADGTPTVRRQMGGIMWFIEEYEKANGGVFEYRKGEAALTDWEDPRKRDIRVPLTGSVTKAQWSKILENIFPKTTSSSPDKLMLCGPGVITALNDFYGDKIVTNKNMQAEHRLGFDLRELETPFGTLYFRVHPRFSEMWMNNDALIVDMANLKLRPMAGADTKIRTNIHANDFDGRKDEFFTEAGLELRFPETFTRLRNFKSIAA